MNPPLYLFVLLLLAGYCHSEQVELIPKMIRWPSHLDHYLCKQLHNGLGVRSHAVTNLNGELCRTYCRIIDRMNGKITYTENMTPNFVRCGPYQARCVDGTCVGLNFPQVPGAQSAPPPPIAAESAGNQLNETAIESSEAVADSQSQLVMVDGTGNTSALYPTSLNRARRLTP